MTRTGPSQSRRADASSSLEGGLGRGSGPLLRTAQPALACRGAERPDGGEGGPGCRSLGEGGFTLVEVLVCTLVLTIGLVAIAAMLAVTTQMQMGARESARSMRLAQAKVDELARLDFEDDVEMSMCEDCLDANVANHNESVAGLSGITLRWNVDDGPTDDTRLVTVRVLNLRAQQYRATDLTTILREW